ncbi:hypothetical protein TD95_001064 [Thielaviopsis punctulata]|uniref:Phytocyanin domain-containing protein n=1 Tax=Thielaviopsis punctulata TaxID=72032 RepID=A0A0F4ZAR7_9PEZI|nr:hypothetical protein TD95_001064 [Thielaviopsis punctulata]
MKFSAAITATLAPVVLAKSAASKFPVIKRDSLVETQHKPVARNGLTGILLGNGFQTIEQSNVIILLWQFPGGPAATTTSLDQTLTVTQTVTVPDKAAAETSTTNAENKEAATTTSTTAATTSAASSTASSVSAGATHTVTVGGPQGLSYFPESIQAAVGDVVQFEFLSQNHTVTQSTFDNPCHPLAGGMNSGFMPNPNNTVNPSPAMAMQVMTSDPLWMYCAQGNHCGHGMVFSINPTASKTHAQFQALAINSTGKGLVGSGLTGGPASLPAGSSSSVVSSSTAAAAASSDAAATATTVSTPTGVQNSIATGTGTLQADGSCLCSVQCGAGSFPVSDQGVGAFGGMAGKSYFFEIS